MNPLTQKLTGRKVFCLTCGDVTDGHPEEDKALAELLNNGFSTPNIDAAKRLGER